MMMGLNVHVTLRLSITQGVLSNHCCSVKEKATKRDPLSLANEDGNIKDYEHIHSTLT